MCVCVFVCLSIWVSDNFVCLSVCLIYYEGDSKSFDCMRRVFERSFLTSHYFAVKNFAIAIKDEETGMPLLHAHVVNHAHNKQTCNSST